MWKLSILAFLGLILMQQAGAICNRCTNGHACVSRNEFRLCTNEYAWGAVFACPNEGQVCTNLQVICELEANGAKPACGNTDNCNICNGVQDGYFACTGRKTFAMCEGNQVNETLTFTCNGEYEFCSVSLARGGQLPCERKCEDTIQDNEICDIDENTPQPTDSTGSSPPSTGDSTVIITPTPPANAADAVCASTTAAGRYPYPNDTACRSYAYCYYNPATQTFVGTNTSCPPNKMYFSPTVRMCQEARPAGCV